MDAPKTLAEALALLQGQLPPIGKHATADVKKDGKKVYDYAYAPGEAITPVLYPLMAALGLSFTAAPTAGPGGGFFLSYSMLHVSGEKISGEYPLPDPARYGPQDLGKAITYARRYALCALTGLFPGGDDTDARGDDSEPLPPARKPRNVPDAKLAAEGRMTRGQAAGHKQLEADTKRQPRRAERSRPSEPDHDDPWAADAPVDHHRAAALRETLSGPDLTEPEDKPGSILPAQHRAIERILGMFGIDSDDRAGRHDIIGAILSRKVESVRELSYTDAAAVVTELNHRWSVQAKANADA